MILLKSQTQTIPDADDKKFHFQKTKTFIRTFIKTPANGKKNLDKCTNISKQTVQNYRKATTANMRWKLHFNLLFSY